MKKAKKVRYFTTFPDNLSTIEFYSDICDLVKEIKPGMVYGAMCGNEKIEFSANGFDRVIGLKKCLLFGNAHANQFKYSLAIATYTIQKTDTGYSVIRNETNKCEYSTISGNKAYQFSLQHTNDGWSTISDILEDFSITTEQIKKFKESVDTSDTKVFFDYLQSLYHFETF